MHYLEAFCRSGSTDRDWHETVIPHRTELQSAGTDGDRLTLRSTLSDGVVVQHEITARRIDADGDAVEFRLTATNPTDKPSDAQWAQPCIRVDKFTGHGQADYLPFCFIYLDGKQAALPTRPWAEKARYTPGQVYCPIGVSRDDVNPRPLSALVPSNGLIGCYSSDRKQILATAWEPYQELFQGVGVCVHSDFRIGGLKPHETKSIRGMIYITDGRRTEAPQALPRRFSGAREEVSDAARSRVVAGLQPSYTATEGLRVPETLGLARLGRACHNRHGTTFWPATPQPASRSGLRSHAGIRTTGRE